jgi:hypothetical protein
MGNGRSPAARIGIPKGTAVAAGGFLPPPLPPSASSPGPLHVPAGLGRRLRVKREQGVACAHVARGPRFFSIGADTVSGGSKTTGSGATISKLLSEPGGLGGGYAKSACIPGLQHAAAGPIHPGHDPAALSPRSTWAAQRPVFTGSIPLPRMPWPPPWPRPRS